MLVLDSEHNGGTCDPTLVDPILSCEASRPTGTELTSADTMCGVSAHLGNIPQSSGDGAVLGYNSASVLMREEQLPSSDLSTDEWDCMDGFSSANTRIKIEADVTNQISPH